MFQFTRSLFFSLLLTLSVGGPVQAHRSQPSSCRIASPCGPWRSHIGPEVQGGNFKRGAGADGWFPLLQTECSVLFTQGGGGWFRDAGVGSLGVGYRQIQCDGRWALGVNGFVDFAYSCLSRSPFGQVGAGFELFECHWIARGNLYVPFTKSKELRQELEGQLVVDGTQIVQQIFFNSSREPAFPGADGEVGYEGELGCGRLGLYGGYFYYKKNGISAIHGPRARVEYRIDQGPLWPNSRGEFIIGAEYERDRLHGQTALIRVGWRSFLGCRRKNCGCYSPLVRYMGRRVMREKAIWIDEITSRNLISEEKVANIFFANNLNNGVGTQTDPALLPNAVASLGGNDILFLLENTGDMTATSTITTLEGDQVLGFGNASSREVTIPGAGTITVNDLTGAGRAVVIGTGLDPVIEAGNNNFLCGFTLQDGVTGIRHQGGNNLQIEDVIVNDTTGTAILNDLGGALSIQQSQVSTTSGIGIRTTQPTGAITIGGSTLDDVIVNAPFGIFIDTVATPTRIMNAKVTSTADSIRITDSTDARVENSTLVGQVGLSVVNTPVVTNRDIRLLNSTITASIRGVSADLNGNGVFVISGSQITSTGGEGVLLLPGALGPWNILIDSNPIISGTTNAITGSGNTSSAIQLSNNTVMAGNNQSAITWLTSNPPMGTTVNVSFLNNQELGVTGTGAGFEARTSGMAFPSGDLCATFIGNSRDVSNASDITLDRFGSIPLFVWDLANLSATNNGLQVNSLGGPVQAAGPCLLPVIP